MTRDPARPPGRGPPASPACRARRSSNLSAEGPFPVPNDAADEGYRRGPGASANGGHDPVQDDFQDLSLESAPVRCRPERRATPWSPPRRAARWGGRRRIGLRSPTRGSRPGSYRATTGTRTTAPRAVPLRSAPRTAGPWLLRPNPVGGSRSSRTSRPGGRADRTAPDPSDVRSSPAPPLTHPPGSSSQRRSDIPSRPKSTLSANASKDPPVASSMMTPSRWTGRGVVGEGAAGR